MNQEKTYNITAYDLWTFLQEVQSAVQQGYVLSDKNENFPQAFVSLYTCALVKECEHDWCFNSETSDGAEAEFQCSKCGKISISKKQTQEVTISDVVANQEKKTAGRKPKVSK